MLCVGEFGVGLWERVCAVCGTVWCGFVGENCAVSWTVWCGFVGESVCCVWDSLMWVCGSDCVLCVGQFSFGLWE